MESTQTMGDGAPAAAPIESDEACAAAIGRIGALDRQLEAIATAKNKLVARAAVRAEQRAGPLAAARRAEAEAVEAWCTANRKRLTAGGGKTIGFATGEASWRKGRARVEIDDEAKDSVLAALERRGLSRMINIVKSIAKSAIAREPSEVKGIRGLTIVPGAEEFSVKPIAAPLVERA